MLIFDIETAALPDCDLRRIFGDPDVGVPLPGVFDRSAVRVGNLKDPAKIEEKIEAARAEHAAMAESYPYRLAEAKAAAFAEFKAKAALSATTGHVLCVGYFWCGGDGDKIVVGDGESDDGDTREAKILREFWKTFATVARSSQSMVGVNIFDFDLPFLVRRSWILGIDVPAGIIGQGRYWHSAFVDLRRIWLCGQSPNGGGVKSSFDELGAAFGTGGKPDGVTGADFAELWERDRAAALKYLENDLRQPAKWAKAMGVC